MILAFYIFLASVFSSGLKTDGYNENLLSVLQQKLYFAKIEVTESDEKLEIVGKFYNNSEDTLSMHYSLESKKDSPSGSSISNQSGKFKSMPNSVSFLTNVGLNIAKNTSYQIKLRVFEDENVVSIDSLSFNSIQ